MSSKLRFWALGHELTAWSVGLATSGENYIIDKLGGRLYGSAKAEQLAFLVLEELGLCVSHEIKELEEC
ncbi:hypothetical protein N7508_006754 [Penicillium antarcticum]|uniref:uncharacterized protein n=1 Tax=Penicillium antarcticum TaxID=416450 RepID=UPI002394E9B6|nr:uncharacterized protein N7508_006754 [Penicillium antarcticum]KAJ5301891.1 hypothetical protein N7508_006754 [Penicillium antarcticum]